MEDFDGYHAKRIDNVSSSYSLEPLFAPENALASASQEDSNFVSRVWTPDQNKADTKNTLILLRLTSLPPD